MDGKGDNFHGCPIGWEPPHPSGGNSCKKCTGAYLPGYDYCAAVCGNRTCDLGETKTSCPTDCCPWKGPC
jgi:hypothetical protein